MDQAFVYCAFWDPIGCDSQFPDCLYDSEPATFRCGSYSAPPGVLPICH